MSLWVCGFVVIYVSPLSLCEEKDVKLQDRYHHIQEIEQTANNIKSGERGPRISQVIMFSPK